MTAVSREVTLPSGLRMHYLEAGRGPLAVLLHGFPELSISWRAQLEGLSRNFRVVAPDLRGYGQTDAPRGWRQYTLTRLCTDVVELIGALGEPRAHVVGHDWGGAIAWEVGQRHPQVVRTLAVCNCPHPRVMLRMLWRARQLRRSWYMFAFQLPGLPERHISRHARGVIIAAFRHAAGRDKALFTADSLAPYIAQARGGLAGGLNYYRAAFRVPPGRAQRIEAPTRLIWGTADPVLGCELARPERYRGLVRQLKVNWIEGAGHWVQQEAPERVNRALADHWALHSHTARDF